MSSHLTNVREGVIIPEEVDNIKFARDSPTYRLLVVPPTGSSTVTINNATVDTYVEITPNVVNLNKSFLEYTLTPTAQAAGVYNFLYKNKPNVQNLNIYTKSGVNIVQIDYLNKMIWMIGRKNMSFKDYMCRAGISCTAALHGEGFAKNLSTLVAVGAGVDFAAGAIAVTAPAPAGPILANAVIGSQAQLLTVNAFSQANSGAISKRPDGSIVSDRFLECQYMEIGSAAASAVPVLPVRFPLADVAETLLALDKDLYFKENLIMKISWEPQQYIGFGNTSVVDPVAAVTTYTGGYTLSGIQLRLAVQTNPTVIKSVMASVDAGLSVDIPFVTMLRNPMNSAIQNINVKINSGMGRSLIKVINSPFNADETKNFAFDNTNLNPANSNPLRIASYYTQLNSQRLQDYNLQCTGGDGNGDDYQWNLPYIKNSAIFNHTVYRANWFHEDNFSNVTNNSEYKESQISSPGLPITNEFTWYFFGSTQGAAVFNIVHHTLIVTRRTLNISPMGVQLV